jgi:hypothetical protein
MDASLLSWIPADWRYDMSAASPHVKYHARFDARRENHVSFWQSNQSAMNQGMADLRASRGLHQK